MRMMLKVSIPVEGGNAAIQNGSLQKIMLESLERLKPEAAYFTADNGQRTAFFVIDMVDVSDMPRIAEPFFIGLNASITTMPVMNAEDLKKGLAKIAQSV